MSNATDAPASGHAYVPQISEVGTAQPAKHDHFEARHRRPFLHDAQLHPDVVNAIYLLIVLTGHACTRTWRAVVRVWRAAWDQTPDLRIPDNDVGLGLLRDRYGAALTVKLRVIGQPVVEVTQASLAASPEAARIRAQFAGITAESLEEEMAETGLFDPGPVAEFPHIPHPDFLPTSDYAAAGA